MAIRHVDPNQPPSALRRGLHAFARTPVGRWWGINVASHADPWLLRHTGGRIRLVGSLPTALLQTKGARSGEVRENPVVYFHDGDDVVLVASSFGRDKNPAWYYNLLAHPGDARLNGDRYHAAEVGDEAERERLYALAVRNYPGYADYAVRTAVVGRRIPVLRLTPA